MRIIDSVSDFPAAIAQNAHPLHVVPALWR